jgi:hypothetical protein
MILQHLEKIATEKIQERHEKILIACYKPLAVTNIIVRNSSYLSQIKTENKIKCRALFAYKITSFIAWSRWCTYALFACNSSSWWRMTSFQVGPLMQWQKLKVSFHGEGWPAFKDVQLSRWRMGSTCKLYAYHNYNRPKTETTLKPMAVNKYNSGYSNSLL